MKITKQQYIDELVELVKDFTREQFDFVLYIIKKVKENDKIIYEKTAEEIYNDWLACETAQAVTV